MTVKNDRGELQRRIETDGRPIKVATAHFGLTLIRLDALRDVPKPWLKGEPGPDGTWTHDDHIDPDIWFWKRWEECGKTVYVAPNVRVGHLELMVSEYDEELRHRWIGVGDWRETNASQKQRPV